MAEAVFDIHIGQSAVDSSVKMNGEDISGLVRAVQVSVGGGVLTRVVLETMPNKTETNVAGVYMPVPRCDQCRFWGKTKGPEQLVYPCRKASNLMFNEHEGDGTVPNEIMTSPDFGCVQWERKA